MRTIGTFYESQAMDYSSVVAAYQEAFKEAPWNEVSKCVDSEVPKRCPGGLSAVAVAAWCDRCTAAPLRPAYEADELVERFAELGRTRPTLWYIEKLQGKVALAAVCWPSDVERLLSEKYGDVPAMQPWLENKFGTSSFVYLDEIFRDKTVRTNGNLRNMRAMFDGFGAYFGQDTIAYRSKQPRLLTKTKEIFDTQAEIAIADTEIPDWRGRDFATITLGVRS